MRDGAGQLPTPRTPDLRTQDTFGAASKNDAELACAAPQDRAAFAAIYDRYADRLHDFCVGLLRDPDAAADCVQDVFCTAVTRLTELREPEKLRPWLYAIARHEALRRLRGRDRERTTDDLPERASSDDDPEALAARSELADLITQAAGGLSPRERTVLELHYRHGLDGPELAAALGVSLTNANTLVGRLRATIERSLGAVLVARHSRQACSELATLLEGWDGELTVLMRKRIARHIDHCSGCDADRRTRVNPRALLGAAPAFVPAPSWLRDDVLAQTRTLKPAAGGAPGHVASQLPGKSWWPSPNLGRVTVAQVLTASATVVAAAVTVPLVMSTVLSGAETPIANVGAAPATAAPTSSALRPSFGFDMPTTQHGPTAPRTPPQLTVPPRPRPGSDGQDRPVNPAPSQVPAGPRGTALQPPGRTTPRRINAQPPETLLTPPPQTSPPTPTG